MRGRVDGLAVALAVLVPAGIVSAVLYFSARWYS